MKPVYYHDEHGVVQLDVERTFPRSCDHGELELTPEGWVPVKTKDCPQCNGPRFGEK